VKIEVPRLKPKPKEVIVKEVPMPAGRKTAGFASLAVGGAGIAVLAPTAGLAVGTAQGGILGGIVGLTGGAVVGVLGGAAIAVSGVFSGVSQIVRGVAAVPKSISEPRKGNWWDENEGKWAKANLAYVNQKTDKKKKMADTMFAGMTLLQMQMKFQAELQNATTDEEKAKLQEAFQKEYIATTLKVMWTTTAVDITSTLYETCQMVFFDKSVDKEVRKLRGKAVRDLGSVFMKITRPAASGDTPKETDAQKLYQEAAEAAMLETIKRKEESAFRNSLRGFK